MESELSTKEIPHTDSIEELAKFWDSCDLTEFADDMEEVSEPVFRLANEIDKWRRDTLRLESETTLNP
jgi:hypothetical protein